MAFSVLIVVVRGFYFSLYVFPFRVLNRICLAGFNALFNSKRSIAISHGLVQQRTRNRQQIMCRVLFEFLFKTVGSIRTKELFFFFSFLAMLQRSKQNVRMYYSNVEIQCDTNNKHNIIIMCIVHTLRGSCRDPYSI